MPELLFANAVFVAGSVSVTPLRREPSHRAEQTSQLLYGERAEVLEHDEARDWAHIRCEWDGYEGWCKWGQLQVIRQKDFHGAKRVITTAHHSVLKLEEGTAQMPLTAEIIGDGKFKGKKADIRNIVSSAELLIDTCKSFLHAPYHWGGRTGAGIDCSGLVQTAFKRCGIRVLRDAGQQASMGTEVHFLQEAVPGDLAFFDNAEGRIVHVGILMDRHNIIHATDIAGRVVIDTIDIAGIVSRNLRRRTHNLRMMRRIMLPNPQLTGQIR